MNFLASPRSFGPALSPISPWREMGAYEALWFEQGATFKTIADRFAADPSAMPSDFIEPTAAQSAAEEALQRIRDGGVSSFGIRVHHAGD